MYGSGVDEQGEDMRCSGVDERGKARDHMQLHL